MDKSSLEESDDRLTILPVLLSKREMRQFTKNKATNLGLCAEGDASIFSSRLVSVANKGKVGFGRLVVQCTREGTALMLRALKK